MEIMERRPTSSPARKKVQKKHLQLLCWLRVYCVPLLVLSEISFSFNSTFSHILK